MSINLLLAFGIGFCQFYFSVILEMMSLMYLSSLITYVFILVCYGTIGTVASFEKIYATALIDNPIKECINKKLYVKYKRHMSAVNLPENCLAPGCNRIANFDQDDQLIKYCCKSHANG